MEETKIEVYKLINKSGYTFQKYGASCYEAKALMDNAAECLFQLRLAIWDIGVALGLLKEMSCPIKFLKETPDYKDPNFIKYEHYFIAGNLKIINKTEQGLKEILNL